MDNLLTKIVALAKRRGFIFQSSEIYGGFSSSYDFGPLGVEMKNNIKKAWWNEMTKFHENIVGLDAAILMSPKVWQASGHLTAGFADELLECKKCHKRFRPDEIQHPRLSNLTSGVCPECRGELTKPRKFNLMMKTFAGPVEDEASLTYLRAETCQGIYMNFENVLNSMRVKIPFGVVQIGKAFRNEITPKDFIFRIREFEQMEMEWFCRPKEADKFFEYWLNERLKWYENLGIKKENLRQVEVPEKKRAHYAKRQIDIEYKFPFGWAELEGIANRTDFDLKNQAKFSGKDLSFQDEDGKKFYPYVIEPSVGVERIILALILEAYHEEKDKNSVRTILSLNPKVSPIKIAIFPLLANKPELVKVARQVFDKLRPAFYAAWDDRGNIGKRYYAQDEIGTPWCVTIDYQTLKDETVTVRDRDTMKQERLGIDKLKDFFQNKL